MPKIPERTKTKAANNIPRIEGNLPELLKSVIRVFSVVIMRMTIARSTQTITSRIMVYRESGGPMMNRSG
jgi:hypothetical protein